MVTLSVPVPFEFPQGINKPISKKPQRLKGAFTYFNFVDSSLRQSSPIGAPVARDSEKAFRLAQETMPSQALTSFETYPPVDPVGLGLLALVGVCLRRERRGSERSARAVEEDWSVNHWEAATRGHPFWFGKSFSVTASPSKGESLFGHGREGRYPYFSKQVPRKASEGKNVNICQPSNTHLDHP